MKQVYYTQCPLGYGLGAANGFQLKRLDDGYPTTGDFRHLGLRAFLPGSRTLSPPSLRYRRDGEVAEVAWLTARTHEYETEQGRLWGRPGGQFAHGLRLDSDELGRLDHWPAGLHGRPFWRTSDPERTLGQPPLPLEVGPSDLLVEPRLETIAPLLEALDQEILSCLLTLIARVVRESRCLFVIAPADALGPLFAGLTFAFPETHRPDLTFSTYHDRPEELTGFRLQGTIPEVRPNRMALAPLGTIADLVAQTFEPSVEPEPWSVDWAHWIRSADQAWTRTNHRLRSITSLPPVETRWSNSWFEALVRFEQETQSRSLSRAGMHDFAADLAVARWADASQLAPEWLAARSASWWSKAGSTTDPQALRAFLYHLRLALARAPLAGHESGTLSEWGETAALWLGSEPSDRLLQVIRALLRSTPPSSQGPWLAAFINALPVEPAAELLDNLGIDPEFDVALLMPISAARYAPALADRQIADEFESLLRRVLDHPPAVVATLEATAAAVESIPSARDQAAMTLARLLTLEQSSHATGRNLAWRWALNRPDAIAWLRPLVLDLARDPDRFERRDVWLAATPPELRSTLARVILETLAEVPGSDDTFTWGVDAILMQLPAEVRPDDPRWADLAIQKRTGLDLLRSLYLPQTRQRSLASWLSPAHRAGRLSSESVQRLRIASACGERLRAAQAEHLESLPLPDVTPERRGELLGLVLDSFSPGSDTILFAILHAAAGHWGAEAFSPQAPGLDGQAQAIAARSFAVEGSPSPWLDRLLRLHQVIQTIRGRDPGQLVEPDGLIARIVRSALGSFPASEPQGWPWRRILFRNNRLWPALALHVTDNLASARRDDISRWLAPWDHELERGSPELESRWAELLLNAAGSMDRFLGIVEAKAAHLATLGPLSAWQDGSITSERPVDLRDHFARQAPMVPVLPDSLLAIRRWMQYSDDSRFVRSELDELDTSPDDRARVDQPEQMALRSPLVTEPGERRWRLIEALSVFSRPKLGVGARWDSVREWNLKRLPLALASHGDVRAFMSQVIRYIDSYDPDDLKQQRNVRELAAWLVDCGLRRPADVQNWTQWLQDGGTVPDASEIARRKELVRDLVIEMRETIQSP